MPRTKVARAFRLASMISDRQGYRPAIKADLSQNLDPRERVRMAKELGYAWSSGPVTSQTV